MATVEFYRAYDTGGDRPLTATEVAAVHQMTANIIPQDRVLDDRPKMTSLARTVGGRRWAAIYRIREGDLPSQTDVTGVVSDLNLPPGTHVAEGTHFVLLDNAVVPIIANADGPSPAAIGRYLKHSSGQDISLRMVMDPDVSEQLDEFGAVTSAQFKVDDLLGGMSGIDDGAGSVIAAARRQDDTLAAVTVTFSWDGDDQAAAADGIVDRAQRWLQQVGSWGRVKTATVRGRDRRDQARPPVRMLQGRIAASVTLDRPDPRRVRAEDAVTAINEATDRMFGALQRAVAGDGQGGN